jgi:hypothetical protein
MTASASIVFLMDIQERLDELFETWEEPRYLEALECARDRYRDCVRRQLPERDGSPDRRLSLRAGIEQARYARGCTRAFADGGFDALFDFQRDFVWRHSLAEVS